MSIAWTWMIYLATNNNVWQYGQESVERMRAAQLGDALQVVIQQATPGRSTRLILGKQPEQSTQLAQLDSGAPETLLDFIRWAAQTCPAQRYALVLWSHGSGWEPSEIERIAQEAHPKVPVTASELRQRGSDSEGRQTFFSSSLRSMLSKDTPADRAIAFDDGSGHALDTLELGRVAAEARQILGQPINLLGMNACQMASAEVAYQLRGNVQLYIASQEDMPAQSWPYDDILTRLGAAPNMPAEALARLIVERYCGWFRDNINLKQSWGKGGFPPGVTLSALQLAGTQQLSSTMNTLAAALQADIAGQLNAIWTAHRKAKAFKFRQYDLASFCAALADHSQASQQTKSAAQAVVSVLNDPAFMLAREYTASAYANTGGLSVYLMFPDVSRSLAPSYEATDFAIATGWGRFLQEYHAAIPR